MSDGDSRGKGNYYFRDRNQGKLAISRENCQSRTPSPEMSTQRMPAPVPAHSSTRLLAPTEQQIMATECTDGEQPVSDASAPLPVGQAESVMAEATENSMLTEIRKMFSSFSAKIEKKLDSVITDITSLKQDVSTLKTTINALEASTSDTSARISSVENVKLPQMDRKITKLEEKLDEKLLALELHGRKQNLLFYGIAPRPQEEIYATVSEAIGQLMNIPLEEAAKVPLINAHRLPRYNQKPDQENSIGSRSRPVGPDPIIVRFARMWDRERILQAFEHPTRQRETRSEARRPTDPRVTVRTDLPPTMKRERGRLAHIAYQLRSNQPGLKTRIKIIGVKVVLQTRKSSEVGSTWSKWSD